MLIGGVFAWIVVPIFWLDQHVAIHHPPLTGAMVVTDTPTATRCCSG